MYYLTPSVTIGLTKTKISSMLQSMASAGFRYVELALAEPWQKPYPEHEEYLKDLEAGIERLQKEGIATGSVHVSFGAAWAFESTDEEHRREAVSHTKALIKRLLPYDIPNLVVHTNGLDFPVNGDREGSILKLRKSLAELAGEGMTVCVENLPRNCLGNTSGEMLRIVDGLPVKIVFDTNHVFKEKPEDFAAAIADKIACLHVSDADGKDEKHWFPLDGTVNFQGIVKVLEGVGYHGLFNYEIGNSPETDHRELMRRHNLIFDTYNRSVK